MARLVTPRRVALAAYAVLFLAILSFKGVPADLFSIVSWLWILSICWKIEEPVRAHLAFIRDWSGPIVLLLLYVYSRELADDIGTGVEYHFPIAIDQALGFGTTPGGRLQAAWCGNPCVPTGTPRWFDRLFIIVWMSHWVIALVMAVVYWLRRRSDWLAWMRRYLTTCFLGLVVYVAVPTAPPWMAARDGELSDPIVRLGARAWIGPRPDGVGSAEDPSSWAGNDVAAMPSLHTAVALLVALYAIQRFSSPWRWLSLLYPVGMGLTLVYFGEHYVADLLAGALLAVAVHAAWSRWERGTRTTTAVAVEDDQVLGDDLVDA